MKMLASESYPFSGIGLVLRYLARFSNNKMLHERQVAIISDFQRTMEGGEGDVKQMIMGAGKTTVASPLLSMLPS